MKRSLALGLVLSILFNSLALAADVVKPAASPGPETPKSRSKHSPKLPRLTPIGVQEGGDEKKPHREYFHDGLQLTSYRQFQDVIGPLGDPEADRLMKAAQGKQGLSTVLDVVGGGFALGGLVYELTAQGTSTTTYPPYGPPLTSTAPPDPAPAILLTGIGVLSAAIGMIVDGDGAHYRDQAVDRYNSLVGEGSGAPENPSSGPKGTAPTPTSPISEKDELGPPPPPLVETPGKGPRTFGFAFSPGLAVPLGGKTTQEYLPGLSFEASFSFVLDPHWTLDLEGGTEDHPINSDYLANLYQQDYGTPLPAGTTFQGGWSYIPVRLSARYSFPTGSGAVTPYLFWGAGVAFHSAQITTSYNGQSVTTSVSENTFLLSPGLGVAVKWGPDRELFFQGRLDMTFMSQDGQDTITLSGNGMTGQAKGNLSDDGTALFLPLQVGLRFWQ
ncbi:MAG TPA: hypothetical protein VHE12_00195 [bacterium]|nr:hypothetical protein [bacterium]